MAWDKGFNFRATSTAVTDPANCTYVLGSDTYPTTRNDCTFGYSSSHTDTRDRSSTPDPRLSGEHFVASGTSRDFTVDLPSAGTYAIRLALGDFQYSLYEYCKILDGTTTLLIAGSASTNVAAQHFVDADGTDLNYTDWPGSNAAVNVTFSGTTLTLRYGDASGTAVVAHLFVSQVTASGLSIPIAMANHRRRRV